MMTERIRTLTLVLTKDIRDDDAESLIIAASQLRGVASVIANASDPAAEAAEVRARAGVADEIELLAQRVRGGWVALDQKGRNP